MTSTPPPTPRQRPASASSGPLPVGPGHSGRRQQLTGPEVPVALLSPCDSPSQGPGLLASGLHPVIQGPGNRLLGRRPPQAQACSLTGAEWPAQGRLFLSVPPWRPAAWWWSRWLSGFGLRPVSSRRLLPPWQLFSNHLGSAKCPATNRSLSPLRSKAWPSPGSACLG